VRAEVKRANFTSKGKEKLNPQQNNESADLDKSTFSLTQKVQLIQGASVGEYPTGDGHSSSVAQASDPQLHNLVEGLTDVLEINAMD